MLTPEQKIQSAIDRKEYLRNYMRGYMKSIYGDDKREKNRLSAARRRLRNKLSKSELVQTITLETV